MTIDVAALVAVRRTRVKPPVLEDARAARDVTSLTSGSGLPRPRSGLGTPRATHRCVQPASSAWAVAERKGKRAHPGAIVDGLDSGDPLASDREGDDGGRLVGRQDNDADFAVDKHRSEHC